MKKIYYMLAFFSANFHISIKEISGVKLISLSSIKKEYSVESFYVHKKFCKILNLKVHTQKEPKKLVLTILLFDNGNDSFYIKQTHEKLDSLTDYHIILKDKKENIMLPCTVEKLIPSLNEELIFGKELVKFGNLFKIVFLDIEENETYTPVLNQPYTSIRLEN